MRLFVDNTQTYRGLSSTERMITTEHLREAVMKAVEVVNGKGGFTVLGHYSLAEVRNETGGGGTGSGKDYVVHITCCMPTQKEGVHFTKFKLEKGL